MAEGTTEKLIRRHPHVFGDATADDSGQVLANWDRIKREQEGKPGLFEDVPENLPALLHARKLQRRVASRAPEAAEGGAEASLEAIDEARERLSGLLGAGAGAGPEAAENDRRAVEEALGQLLFAAVDVARRAHCDPELALRAASERFRVSIEADA